MKILFFGKDNRYDILIDNLKNKYDIYGLGYGYRKDIKIGDISNINKYDIIVLPMSGFKNNKVDVFTLPSNFFDNFKGIIYTGLKGNLKGNVISFLSDSDIVLENTKITVDGIIDKISNINIKNVCILGYGNIGSILYDKIKDKYNVYVGVNRNVNIKNSFKTDNYEDMKKIFSNSDIIINTVPSHIIPDSILQEIKCYFLDVASYPYAINKEDINNYSFKYELYSQIPSKYDPKRAGKILLKKF